MHISMATSAGHPGRPNEDFVGAVPSAVVLLDGAGIPGTESICRHGVAWYTHRLGGALLARLSRDDGRDLTAVLAEAIDEIAADHRSTCDITNPSSPQATVVIARLNGSLLDYLLACRLFPRPASISAGPLIMSDEREVTARRICMAPLAEVARGTAEYERIRDHCIEALQAAPEPRRRLLDRQRRSACGGGSGNWQLPAARPGQCRAAEQWCQPDCQPVRSDQLAWPAGTARHRRACRDHPPRPPGRSHYLTQPRSRGSRRRHRRALQPASQP